MPRLRLVLLLALAVTAARGATPPRAEGEAAFAWNDCAPAGAPVAVKALAISPAPVRFGQNVTVSFDVQAKGQVPAAWPGGELDVELTIKKHAFGTWVKVPCVDGVGSCKIENVCQSLAVHKACPIPHLPCQCPLQPNDYVLAPTTFALPVPPKLPSWLEVSDLHVTAVVTDGSRAAVACVDVFLSVRA